MRIDAHHHLWNYSAEQYGWIGDDMRALRRNFLPPDLLPELRAVDIGGTVAVQARQSLAETVWLLDLADEYDWIQGIVGWVPLMDEKLPGILEHLTSQTKLKGVRHVLQDEPNADFMVQTTFQRGIAALEPAGLVYDLLIREHQLDAAIRLVDCFPRQRFVLDHIAKPRIKANLLEPWRANLRELARRPNVYCKLSGVATEADWKTWSEETVHPYLETAAEAFSPKRLMFGSDWPVCLAATTYRRWFETVERFTSNWSATERERIFGETAREAYSL